MDIPVPSSELDPLPFVPIVYRRQHGRFDDGTRLPECAPVPSEWAQFYHMDTVIHAVRTGASLRDPGLGVQVQIGLNATLASLQRGGQEVPIT